MLNFKTCPIQGQWARTVLSVALATALFSPNAGADVNTDIERALKFNQDDAKYGQIKFDLNLRYEYDDSDSPLKEGANAMTGRLRIGYLSPEFKGFQGYAEYEGNQDIVENNYNSTRNGKTGYETIADPQEHELNQLWISYKGLADTEIKLGRQEIKLDNMRFIGNLGWRQLEMTYDGVMITNQTLPNTTVKVGYINQAQTVQSYMKAMQTPLVNVSYNFKGIGDLTSYAYLMDFNENDAPLSHYESNQTYGVRFDGGYAINDTIKALYTAEYAYQRDYQQSPVDYEADYYHVIAGADIFGVTAKAGFEQLGGYGMNKTFDTPLGNLHAFDGWSDQFLITPANGLRDVYGSLGYEIEGIKLAGIYHEFADDTSQIDYGKEWDFQVTKTFAKHYTLLAKYAYYDAAANSGFYDTENFWFSVNVNF